MATLPAILMLTEGFLVIWLQILIRRRIDRKLKSRHLEWTGEGPDLSTVSETVGRIRRDYLAAARSYSTDALPRAVLVASARRALMQLAYFNDREHRGEHHSMKPEMENRLPQPNPSQPE